MKSWKGIVYLNFVYHYRVTLWKHLEMLEKTWEAVMGIPGHPAVATPEGL
jgi:hypothetical protein